MERILRIGMTSEEVKTQFLLFKDSYLIMMKDLQKKYCRELKKKKELNKVLNDQEAIMIDALKMGMTKEHHDQNHQMMLREMITQNYIMENYQVTY